MSKAERQQAREKAQERAQAALDRLGEGVREVWQSERWESWLRSLAKFHDYSLGNTILIAMQMPTATHVASFRSWKRGFNRYVKKGERGIEILVPMLVKDRDEDTDEERRRLVGFRVGHVFDVSQTDGEPLPTLVDEVAGDVDRYAAVLDAVRAVSAYPIELVADLPEGTKGLFRRGEFIAIREGMPEGQTVKTALHELAHSRLHDGDPEVLKSTPDLPIWARFLHQPGQYRSTSTGNGISRNRCLRPPSRGCLQAGPWSCRTFRRFV